MAQTLYLTHTSCLDHATPPGHPERADRLRVIEQALGAEPFAGLARQDAPWGTLEQVGLAHPQAYASAIRDACPDEGLVRIDGDTTLSPGSFEAAMRAVGAACQGVDAVMAGEAKNAFSACRPPGHHAERSTAMGFCLFNNAAIAARHAQAIHGAERVAIVDFDVHHGNGTQDIVWDDPSILYASAHQAPLFPGTGAKSDVGAHGTIINTPLAAGDGAEQFGAAFDTVILPRLEAFKPDLLVISAGFDMHARDPLANMQLEAEDFGHVTEKLMELAARCCQGRIVSLLEGGYDLQGLASSVSAHVDMLMQG